MLFLLTACELPPVLSEQGEWSMAPDAVFSVAPGAPPHNGAIVVGTRFCPRLEPRPSPESDPNCTWETTHTGQTMDEDGCITAVVGEATWTFQNSCGSQDRLSWKVVEFDTVTASLDPLFEGWLRTEIAQPTGWGVRADGSVPGPLKAIATVAGTTPMGLPLLQHPTYGAVGYSISEDFQVPMPEKGQISVEASGQILHIPVAEASVETITSLDLFAIYMDPLGGVELPVGVRAVAQDLQGTRIFGVPIEWTTVGSPHCLTIDLDSEPDPMTLIVTGNCDQPDRGESTVSAKANDLSATITLRWARSEGPEAPEVDPQPEHIQTPAEAQPDPEPAQKKRRRRNKD